MTDEELPDISILPSGPISLTVANKVYLTFTPDGRVIPGPDLSTDEATRAMIDQLGATLSRRIADLERELASALEIVRAVARFDDDNSYDGAYCCHWCGAMYDGVGDAPTLHTPDCLITKARALLDTPQHDATPTTE